MKRQKRSPSARAIHFKKKATLFLADSSSQKNLIDAEAFLGEIAHFNVWSSKITNINDVKTNCDGFHGGDLVHWSVGSTAPETIDAHHSASIIKADVTGMCEGLCEVIFATYLIIKPLSKTESMKIFESFLSGNDITLTYI